MFPEQDRNRLRGVYVSAWRKHRSGAPLEPLEAQVVDVVAAHPEYHQILEGPPSLIDRDYPPGAGETNPFLHMGLHLALREQISGDRPAGIGGIFQALARQTGDAHAAEHRMMDCLAEALWQAQRAGTTADEADYLACLRRRLLR